MRQPWFKFYPGDWRQCPELQLCSLEARGLWIDLLCLAHQGEPYGHVTVNGKALSTEQIATLVGQSVTVVAKALLELCHHGVCDRIDGTVVSRRLVRDSHLSRERSKAGSEGAKARWGDRFAMAKVHSKAMPQKSEAICQKEEGAPRRARKARAPFDWRATLSEFPKLDTDSVRAAVEVYLGVRSKTWTNQGMRLALRKVEASGPAAAVVAFENATEGQWATLWPKAGSFQSQNGKAVSGRVIENHPPDYFSVPRNQDPPKLAELLAERRGLSVRA